MPIPIDLVDDGLPWLKFAAGHFRHLALLCIRILTQQQGGAFSATRRTHINDVCNFRSCLQQTTMTYMPWLSITLSSKRFFGRADSFTGSFRGRWFRGVLRVLVQPLFQFPDSLTQFFIHLQQRDHELPHTRWCHCPFFGWNSRRNLNFTHRHISTNSCASGVLSSIHSQLF